MVVLQERHAIITQRTEKIAQLEKMILSFEKELPLELSEVKKK
jgi:hypothetical protein